MIEKELAHTPIVYYLSEEGNREWVLFLHAAYATHHMFDEQIEALRYKYNMIIPDIIGHGKSTKLQKKDCLTDMAGWINTLLQEENIAKIHVVGISLGAVLAQDFANHYPHRIQSLACFGGYHINGFDPKLQKENRFVQILTMGKALFSMKWFAKANKQICAYTPKAQEAFYKMNLQFQRKYFIVFVSLNKMVNTCTAFPREYPLLIGCGEYDNPMALKAIELWHRQDPSSEVRIVKGAGHCVNMDVPDEFHQMMETFWQKGSPHRT